MENKKKLYYVEGIHGSITPAVKIRKAFTSVGVKNADNCSFDNPDAIYFGLEGGSVHILYVNEDTPLKEFIREMGIHVMKAAKEQPSFKPFDKVLVRDNDNEIWMCQLYSHWDKNSVYPHRTMLGGYKQCIPYEGNECLAGTNITI